MHRLDVVGLLAIEYDPPESTAGRHGHPRAGLATDRARVLAQVQILRNNTYIHTTYDLSPNG
jgi:hypothetical protein